ncbi:AmmeMemoRadiSam system radical SAM enzyme [Butyrivibrio sp. VCB2006]|uniref:AmmeMemoRadiSam system radical SAM enzyme n=1 Tax=Butyrivibrio sp. VCB2006 TaxID=1280679 RepID=UPI0003F8B0F1|nr:AmmeMemoRadiSam system radical SAM enzyme [Butyrivibrio sp. VCB2006]
MPRCNVCYRHCEIREGETGFCGVRGVKNAGNGDPHNSSVCRDELTVYPINYGKITSIALDPIEKKPLSRFMPGSRILSVGSYGCNLRCPFCQNYEISWSDEAYEYGRESRYLSPEDLAELALEYKREGNVGVAFTYNEPLIGYEYVRDTAKLVHENGMVNVLVSNGMASQEVLQELIPYIDAMNIDLKGFTDNYYRDILGGDRQMVMEFIAEAVKHCHIELTTLIIPGENDSAEEIKELSHWISELTDAAGNGIGQDVPLHISRFFPRFHMTDRDATDVDLVYELADVARKNLNYVYTGNC